MTPLPRDAEIPLSKKYAARAGRPVVDRVGRAIFERRYFAACLACGYCNDACCGYGVDADAEVVSRVLAQAEAIERRVGVPRGEWFAGPLAPDADLPGGAGTRTRVVGGSCVFKSRTGRGCLLHAHALETGQDYHLVKPMVSALFPVTFGDGALALSEELADGTLVCRDDGPTAYEAVRPELAYYFGAELVAELDGIAKGMATERAVSGNDDGLRFS